MLHNLLSKYNVTLGSNSSRRKELLNKLGVKFNIQTTNKEELFPSKLKITDIPKFLAEKKSFYIKADLNDKDLLITADTIVILNNLILNKPINKKDAFNMLLKLSNTTHKVITGVCIRTKRKKILFDSISMVTFRKLSKEEINNYISHYNPLDKAGAYGIQDWIGKIGVVNINGSYTNIVGLPLAELYENLKKIK